MSHKIKLDAPADDYITYDILIINILKLRNVYTLTCIPALCILHTAHNVRY